jgi:hypothetical protein
MDFGSDRRGFGGWRRGCGRGDGYRRCGNRSGRGSAGDADLPIPVLYLDFSEFRFVQQLGELTHEIGVDVHGAVAGALVGGHGEPFVPVPGAWAGSR